MMRREIEFGGFFVVSMAPILLPVAHRFASLSRSSPSSLPSLPPTFRPLTLCRKYIRRPCCILSVPSPPLFHFRVFCRCFPKLHLSFVPLSFFFFVLLSHLSCSSCRMPVFLLR